MALKSQWLYSFGQFKRTCADVSTLYSLKKNMLIYSSIDLLVKFYIGYTHPLSW